MFIGLAALGGFIGVRHANGRFESSVLGAAALFVFAVSWTFQSPQETPHPTWTISSSAMSPDGVVQVGLAPTVTRRSGSIVVRKTDNRPSLLAP